LICILIFCKKVINKKLSSVARIYDILKKNRFFKEVEIIAIFENKIMIFTSLFYSIHESIKVKLLKNQRFTIYFKLYFSIF